MSEEIIVSIMKIKERIEKLEKFREENKTTGASINDVYANTERINGLEQCLDKLPLQFIMGRLEDFKNIEPVFRKLPKLITLILNREHQISHNDNTWFSDGIYTNKLAALRNDISRKLEQPNDQKERLNYIEKEHRDELGRHVDLLTEYQEKIENLESIIRDTQSALSEYADKTINADEFITIIKQLRDGISVVDDSKEKESAMITVMPPSADPKPHKEQMVSLKTIIKLQEYGELVPRHIHLKELKKLVKKFQDSIKQWLSDDILEETGRDPQIDYWIREQEKWEQIKKELEEDEE